MASKLKVKINNNDDTRLWRYTQEDDFEGLRSFISSSWATEDFIAQYKDDEEDLITIATAQDLKDAFAFARDEGMKSLKIFVQTLAPQPVVGVPEDVPEMKDDSIPPKVFGSMREMIVDFLTNQAILEVLPRFFGAFIGKVTAAMEVREGQLLKPQEICTMLRGELEEDQYALITSHPLFVQYGEMAIPYIGAKVTSQQSLYPHFRTETIQQWIGQLIAILQQVLQQTAGGCFNFKDVVIDIEYPAKTDTGKVIHFGVECDLCGQYPIIGDRYKCSICPDWDCCTACEPQHDHPLIKFKKASKDHRNASFNGLTEIVRQLGDSKVVPKVVNKDNEEKEAPIGDIDLYDERVPDCICGAKMVCVVGNKAYGDCSVVFCDGCNKKVWKGMVLHCPNGKDKVHHSNGFDLCNKCGVEKYEEDLAQQQLKDAAEKEKEESIVVVEPVQLPMPVPVVVVDPVEEPQEPVEVFLYQDKLVQIKTIMAMHSAERDEEVKTLLVQHKGDISRVVPLLLD